MSDSKLKRKPKPRGGNRIKERQEQLKQQVLANSFLADKLNLYEITEVVQPSGEIATISVNIQLVVSLPQREWDIFTEIERHYEFDCLFNTLRNIAQEKFDRKKVHSNKVESNVETITLFPDNEVDIKEEIEALKPNDLTTLLIYLIIRNAKIVQRL